MFSSESSPFGPSPFGQSSPFGTPISNPFASSNNANPFEMQNKQVNPFMNTNSNEDLNIDDMIKKIDERIAELEAEEKTNNEAKENEAAASEKPTVEDMKQDNKIELNPFNKKQEKQSHDIMDDYLEDLSLDDEDTNENKETLKPVKEDVKPEIVKDNTYTNNEEKDKIMNKKEKDDEDFFDEFFE